jgi:hypothetical protein
MDQPAKPFDLSPEQRDTEFLIRRLLGPQIADRYVDFCLLAAGECALRVSSPMAGHALRELESIVRQTLAAPMEATLTPSPEALAMVEAARGQLHALGFSKTQIDNAIDKGLAPRLSHAEQIEAIVTRLGLASDGDIARAWKKLTGAHGKAHGRAFYNSLKVDDRFRADWQVPLDTVMRGLMIALQGRYATFMKRIEDLVAAVDCAKAANDFSKEIPGALPLLWHFFNRLQSPDWLPHLARLNLLAAPVSEMEERGIDSLPLGQWPAGRYLQRMAACGGPKARRLVADALRAVSASTHPHVLQSGMDILAALPAGEAAPLVDLAELWLNTGDRFMMMGEGPHRLIRNLAEGQQDDAALRVMRALFKVFEEDGRLTTLFSSHMYEHFLPGAVKVLAPVAGPRTVALLCNLLDQAVRISGRVTDDPPHDYTYYLSSEISEEGIKHDVTDALVGEIVDAAKLALVTDPTCMAALLATIRGHHPKIFIRIGLHILSLNPAAVPGVAETLLKDRELIEQSWCRKEYAELALAWFTSLPAAVQKQILDYVDSVPDQIRDGWKLRFAEHEKRQPTAEEEESFSAAIICELLWSWRAALPKERRQAVETQGDPDAWRNRIFEEPQRPTTTPDLAMAPIEDIASFLATWRPSTSDKRQTATALAQDLRGAAFGNPALYSTHAVQFAELPAIYVRNILQGLVNAAANKNKLDWDGAQALIRAVLERPSGPMPTGLEGDDPDWSWSRKAAAELLAHGLRGGAEGISFAHAAAVRALILAVNRAAPRDPDTENFEESYRRFPHYGAQSTMRGTAVELAILYLFWLSKDENSEIGQSPRDALAKLPDIARLFEAELTDQTANGRIPRAVMGRYLTWFYYFGEDWLRANLSVLFPEHDLMLRDASWLSHLSADRGPINELAESLRACFVTEIERLGRDSTERDQQHVDDRFSEYIVILYIAEAVSDDVFELFWVRAPLRARQHAMWFLGVQLELPPDRVPPDRHTRAVTYWERRVAAAKAAPNPEAFREEIGAVGQFFMRKGIDGEWLMDQVLAISAAGFAPTDGYSVMDRLSKISAERPDRAAEVLSVLVKNPHFDRWTYLSQKAALRTIMQNGLATRSPDTAARVAETINHLAALGDTDYLDLLPTAPPEAA